ncbi:MAG: hypothetical protein DRH12_12780 [Deltaproteobacteria bacterium]|nr:MAG: hypothetical protein DRH12_12780 [Deltaproteobacteria bacterium]
MQSIFHRGDIKISVTVTVFLPSASLDPTAPNKQVGLNRQNRRDRTNRLNYGIESVQRCEGAGGDMRVV